MVKNEMDIIESFIRYNINIVDEMIILDNGSTDYTLDIINNLIEEGLNIVLLHDEDSYYNQDVKMTKLMHKAVNEFDADMICVIDADEFIASQVGNPREIIENLDSSKYYQLKWVTYVLTGEEGNDIKFIPSKINHIRDEKYEHLYKVIVPAEIVKNYDVSLKMGNHNLVFNSGNALDPNRDLNLKIAHFPLRSKDQCMSKILVGWPNLLEKHQENNEYGVHWKLFFEEIRKNNTLSDEDLEKFSKNYSFAIFRDDIEIKKQPMNLDFCQGIEIKYDFDYNYLANILDNYLYMSSENIIFKNKIDSLEKEVQGYKESKSWKITKPFRSLVHFFKNHF